MVSPARVAILWLLVLAGCAAGNAERETGQDVAEDGDGEVAVVVKAADPSSGAQHPDIRNVSASVRDCEAEQIECFRWCWKNRVPWPHGLSKDARYRFCQAACLAKYMECLGAMAAKYTFSNLGAAMAWLNAHPDVAVGAIVVAAGGLFVVATDGAGALFLSPLVAR